MTGQPQRAMQAQKILRLAMHSPIHMHELPRKMGMVSRLTALGHQMSTRGKAAVLMQQALKTRYASSSPECKHWVKAFPEG